MFRPFMYFSTEEIEGFIEAQCVCYSEGLEGMLFQTHRYLKQEAQLRGIEYPKYLLDE